MLQQTQVSTVLGYYDRFLARFPDVATLAAAPIDDVLRHWSGLGYYSRARNLHACARAVVERHGGAFPATPEALEALPGIGRSTAAAIAAFAWGVAAPILDGNVKRVLCRVFAVDGFPGERAVEQRLWALAAQELPPAGEGRIETYTQALMDLGATLCVRSRPRCEACPVAARCEARAQDRVGALPTPRPARVTDTRAAEWLLLRAGAAVLLERRASSGLWGGLWSLPELSPPHRAAPGAPPAYVPDAGEVAAWVAARLGSVSETPVPVAQVRHAFTHFRLRARVWQAVLPAGATAQAPDGHLWLALSEAGSAPLPRPVKTLLTGLTSRLL
jgi:A/G-specific adenine glycosylase